MNRRRRLTIALAALPCAPPLALGQRRDKVWKVGFLSPRSRPPSMDADYYGAFRRTMRELGYVEGSNMVVESRFAAGDYARLPQMAAELVRLDVDVILALGPPGVAAAQKATATIPIVFVVSADPVAFGFVKSLARPGGNVTGLFNLAGDLTKKQLEMLAAVVPNLSRVAVLVNPANAGHQAVLADLALATRHSAVRTIAFEATTRDLIGRAFRAIAGEKSEALIVGLDPLFIQEASEIAKRAKHQRLPSISANREYAEAGGLLSYGQNQVDIYRRVAHYVDRIFKGARPATMPVEQPTKLELVVNGVTAKSLGIAIPPSLLARADNVIG
ncbi:MAG TPA: ABC transporter substrate-binding protein [Casimicrobiaceae bacterium]|nr:ABC transporter substrate-binding protein [Casimicrobiaceae bacterium]